MPTFSRILLILMNLPNHHGLPIIPNDPITGP
jgi:hypothetical protein